MLYPICGLMWFNSLTVKVAASLVQDDVAIESFFSSQKTERTGRRTYRTQNEARADMFDYIERFYNPAPRHETLG